MRKLLVLLLLFTCCTTPVPEVGSPSLAGTEEAQLKSDIPVWEPGFLKEIEQRSQQAALHDLRSASLPDSDLELRMWIGFGSQPLRGFVIKRSGGAWAATYLMPIEPDSPGGVHQRQLPAPASGWERFWDKLVDKGVLTLPDSSKLGDEDMFPDGESYVVEIRTGRNYRTYKYGIPEYQEWPEAKRMVEIRDIIFNEFNVRE